MPDLSLREKIEATLFPTLVDNGRELICRDDVLAIIDAHERDLVARIEERRFPTCGCSSGCRHDEVNTALDYILALIKSVAKDAESLCPAKPENRDSKARDERPARDALFATTHESGDEHVFINGDESSFYARAIVEAIDAAAERIVRALEGRK